MLWEELGLESWGPIPPGPWPCQGSVGRSRPLWESQILTCEIETVVVAYL